jgi:heme-degrading monooxygenase HmoA
LPIRVVLTVDIRAGEEEAFEREFQDVARKLAGAPGMVSQMLCRSKAEGARYAISSDWTTREAFHTFETSPEQDEATGPVRRHRTSVQMEVFDIVLDAGSSMQGRVRD